MSKKQFTAVYVFGPTRCHDKYSANEVLDRENGEWVKIGQTDVDMDVSALSDGTVDDFVASAVKKRIIDEVRTGISDWCDIYDSFLFPKAGLQVDNAIRNLLTNDIYELDNSKAERNDGLGDIPPGKEYVYGCSRNHIKHAVESYDHQLIVSASEVSDIMAIKKICEFNNISMAEDDQSDGEEKTQKKAHRVHRNMDLVLSTGDVVRLWYNNQPVCDASGNQVEAVYVGGNKYSYNGEEPAFSSPLACRLLNKFAPGPKKIRIANGNDFWSNAAGTILTALFDSAVKTE